MNIKIKELPKNERPRERLINNGVSALSNEELLAIILKTGTKDMSVKALASYILKSIGNIQNLKNVTYQKLLKIKGIGRAKACLILATIELSKRMNMTQSQIIDVKITSPDIVYNYYKNIVSTVQENFYCLYLNPAKKVLEQNLLFVGTVDYSIVHPRDVFRRACEVNASSFICVHNHPNGNVNPSKQDYFVTQRLKELGHVMGIELIDHIIISEGKYYSFLENGKI